MAATGRSAWARLSGWREGAFAFRLLLAAAIAYGVVEGLHLGRGYSAILSALIVVRPYQEGAIKAGMFRLAATAVGIGLAFGASLLQRSGVNSVALLFLTLAPLSLLAAYDASYRTALISAVILLTASGAGAPNVEVAIARALAVTIGAAIGIGVTMAVLPSPHHRTITDQAVRVLDAALKLTIENLAGGRKPKWLEQQDQRLRRLLLELGRTARDGKAGDPNDTSARIVGLVRRTQAQLLLLRSGWRSLELDEAARGARADVFRDLEAALPLAGRDRDSGASMASAFRRLGELAPAADAKDLPEAWLLRSLARDVKVIVDHATT
jgi:uncharacterized membrane protein YccC